jgi:UDP-N-acetylmuramate--alanine ligase
VIKLLKKNSHIHLIGIGGVSMSGIAKILSQRGYKVSGSDLEKSKYIQLLADYPIDIYIGHDKNNIKGADIIVKTSAIPDNNPEIAAAEEKNIKIIKRAEMLAYLMKDKKTIAVAGTHGKTTTTAMLAAIMKKANTDPAVMVGGFLKEIGGNISDGSGEYFITEADESDGSFLYFDPDILLLTNLELDHPDFYKDLNEFKAIFKRFANKNDKKALVLYNKDDYNLVDILKKRAKSKTFSLNSKSDFSVNNINYRNGLSTFDLNYDNTSIKLELDFPGEYNIYNAAAAASTAINLGVEKNKIKEALKDFSGVGRRFELRGKLLDGKVDIVDDYAHHPTEIKSLLKAVKNMGYKKITAVFQPHRYSRTERFFEEFAESFKDADFVYLTDIYSASENYTGNISIRELEKKIRTNSGTECRYLADFDIITKELKSGLSSGEIIITIGAGDVNSICEKMLK